MISSLELKMLYFKYIIFYFIFPHQTNRLIQAEPIMGHNIQNALGNQFPFVISLGYKNNRFPNNREKVHFCGGTLITHKHILTAAHCVEGKDMKSIEVKVGGFDLRNAKIYSADSAVTYEEYTGAKCLVFGGDSHDIAILKLSTCVSEDIEIASLTKRKNTDLYGLDAVMVGWGETDYTSVSRYLLFATTYILSNDQCREAVETAMDVDYYNYPGKRIFCSMIEPYTLLGSGDSGGPLLIDENEVIGVVSKMAPSRKTYPDVLLSMRVNVFVGIEYYRSFINNAIGGQWERQRLSCNVL